MFNFKTKGYYKKCLAMQQKNNKIINEHLMNEKKLNQEFSTVNNAYAKAIEQSAIEIQEYKKEIKNLKSKNTKLTNEIKKLKGEK